MNTLVPQTIYCNAVCKQESYYYCFCFFFPLSDKLYSRRTRNKQLPPITAVVCIGPGAEHDEFSNSCIGFRHNKTHVSWHVWPPCVCMCVAAFALDSCASCSEVGRCSLTSERSVESELIREANKECVCIWNATSGRNCRLYIDAQFETSLGSAAEVPLIHFWWG